MKHPGERMEVNPAVMLGKLVIKGTRITVESIIDELAAGYSVADVLKAHPLCNRKTCTLRCNTRQPS